MTKSLNNESSKCLAITGAIGVSKIEPSTYRPNISESRQLNKQKYTNLRRERLKPASIRTMPANKKKPNGSNFETYTISRQMDKKQRFDLFMKRLAMKPAVSTSDQVIELLNNTIIEIEDKYAPSKENKFYSVNSKRYGRMHPIPNDRIKFNSATGLTEVLSVGLITYVHPNGYFEMWTVPRGRNLPKRIFKKNPLPKPETNDRDSD